LWGLNRWRDCLFASPHEDTILLIHSQFLGVDELVFHRLKEVVIKLEANLQSTIRDPFLTLEQFKYLGEDFIEGHGVTLR
jgi:hypothetical protein